VPSMPRSALENVTVDYCVALAEIPSLLARLTTKTQPRKKETVGAHAMSNPEQNFSTPVAQTCPECGGAMREEHLGTLMQFRCHIGHVMTAEVLARANLDRLENDISVCVRASHERAELCREIARKYDSDGAAAAAQEWHKAAEQAEERTRVLAALAEKEWIDPTRASELN
jgi:two-component system chemotaxis response regulator CheB